MKVNVMDSIICVFNKKEVVVKINDKFERLTVLNIFKQDGKWCAKCRCDCGKIIDKIIIRSLLSGNTKSCGCLNKDLTIERNFKHGFKTRSNRTRLYNIWVDMRRRCSNPNRKDAANYCLKGIKVCEEWDDYSSFYDWAIANGYNDNLTLERIDNNKNYEPNNCKWIPKSEQSKNRTSNHYITYNNQTKTLTDWAKELGIKRTTLSNRIRKGWPIEKAFGLE